MPRRHAIRPIAERGERNLAQRIERERTSRGWSYEQLATAMTEVGCEITKAALRSIEKGQPPRRITVDEQLAFAEIFTDGDVLGLLRPVELIDQDRAQVLIAAILRAEQDMAEAGVAVFDAAAELLDLAAEQPDLAEYVMGHVMTAPASTTLPDGPASDASAEANLVVRRLLVAAHAHDSAIKDAAGIWAAYRSGRWAEDQHVQVLDELAGKEV